MEGKFDKFAGVTALFFFISQQKFYFSEAILFMLL